MRRLLRRGCQGLRPELQGASGVSVLESTERMLEELGKRAPGVAASPEAALALELAAQLDDQSNSATSKGMNSKEFRETMAALRAMAPAKQDNDRVDEVNRKRRQRRRRSAA